GLTRAISVVPVRLERRGTAACELVSQPHVASARACGPGSGVAAEESPTDRRIVLQRDWLNEARCYNCETISGFPETVLKQSRRISLARDSQSRTGRPPSPSAGKDADT